MEADRITDIQLGIIHLMSEYEKEYNTSGRTYLVRRLIDYSEGRTRLDEETFVNELYRMARNGQYVQAQGNVGSNTDPHENAAKPDYVEVALTDIAKLKFNSSFFYQGELHVYNHYCVSHYFDWFFNEDLYRGPATELFWKQFNKTIWMWFPLHFSEFYLPKDSSREEIIKAVYTRPLAGKKIGTSHSRRMNSLANNPDCLEYMFRLVSLDYSVYDKIFYWLEKSADSYLALLFLCTIVNAPIAIIDVSRFSHEGHPVSTFDGVGRIDFNSQWWELRDTAVTIDKDRRKELAAEWKRWCGSKYPIRVMGEDGTIRGVREYFLDDIIKKAILKGGDWRHIVSSAEREVPYVEFKGRNGWEYISERLRLLCESKAFHAVFAESGEQGSLFEEND